MKERTRMMKGSGNGGAKDRPGSRGFGLYLYHHDTSARSAVLYALVTVGRG